MDWKFKIQYDDWFTSQNFDLDIIFVRPIINQVIHRTLYLSGNSKWHQPITPTNCHCQVSMKLP